MNSSRPVHLAAYALVTATPVALPTARTTRSRVHARPRQRCLIRLRPDESAMPAISGPAGVQPDTEHDLRPCRVPLDLGLARGYERGGCIAVTGDRASTS